MKKSFNVIVLFIQSCILTCLFLFMMLFFINNPQTNKMECIHIITISIAGGLIGVFIFLIEKLQNYYYKKADILEKKKQQDRKDRLGR